MGIESWLKKNRLTPKEKDDVEVLHTSEEGVNVSDPSTGAMIGHADDANEAKRKLRQHFEDQREAA